VTRALFFGLGSDGTVSANKATIKIIGEETDAVRAGLLRVRLAQVGLDDDLAPALRPAPHPLDLPASARAVRRRARPGVPRAPRRAGAAMPGATVLLNTAAPRARCGTRCRARCRRSSSSARCKLYVIDGYGVAERGRLGRRINTVMQVCFFALSGVLPDGRGDGARSRRSLEQTYGKARRRGGEAQPRRARRRAGRAHAVPVPARRPRRACGRRRCRLRAPDFVQRVTRLMLEGRGDELPVSAFPPDGTWPTGTSKLEKRAIARTSRSGSPSSASSATSASMICPHAAIRTKVFAPEALAGAPEGFRRP
jgi:pyruvate-ferredoxin/flavodoxin oxidoreductase